MCVCVLKKKKGKKQRKGVLCQLGKYIQHFLQRGCYEGIDMARKLKANDSYSGESEENKTLTRH